MGEEVPCSQARSLMCISHGGFNAHTHSNYALFPLLDGENSSSLPQVRAASNPSVLFMGGRFRRGPDDPPDRGQLVGGDRLQPEPLQLGLPLGVAQRVHLLLQVAAQHVDAAVELHLVCNEGRKGM